jgi:hypothetical protein
VAFLMKRFTVTVSGFPAYDYDAVSIGKARAKAWGSYCSYRAIPFKEFLKISAAKAAESIPEGYGRPILVSGAPAYWVGDDGQYVRFVRDDETHTLLSHPLDVSEVAQ